MSIFRVLRSVLPAGLLALVVIAQESAEARIIRSTGLTSGVPNCPGWVPSQKIGIFATGGNGTLLGESTPFVYSISGVDDGTGNYIQHGCISQTEPDYYEFDLGDLLEFEANYTGPGGTFDDGSALWNYVTPEFSWTLTDENDPTKTWTFTSATYNGLLTGSGLPGPGEYGITVAMTLTADPGFMIATQQLGLPGAPWHNVFCSAQPVENQGCPTWTSITSPSTKVWIYGVPEPTPMLLMMLGLAGVVAGARARKSAS